MKTEPEDSGIEDMELDSLDAEEIQSLRGKDSVDGLSGGDRYGEE